MYKGDTIGFSLSLGVQKLSESNVIPNRMEAWNILGEKSLAFGLYLLDYLDLRAPMDLTEANKHINCTSVTQKPPGVIPV